MTEKCREPWWTNGLQLEDYLCAWLWLHHGTPVMSQITSGFESTNRTADKECAEQKLFISLNRFWWHCKPLVTTNWTNEKEIRNLSNKIVMHFGGSHNTVKSPVVSAKAYNGVIRNYG